MYCFFDKISHKLFKNIKNKFNVYKYHGDIYTCKSLKILNPRIWKYSGIIYNLRIDNGKESARLLFIKENNNIIILHGFLKKAQKTPKKEAYQAIDVYLNSNSLNKLDFIDSF